MQLRRKSFAGNMLLFYLEGLVGDNPVQVQVLFPALGFSQGLAKHFASPSLFGARPIGDKKGTGTCMEVG